MKHLSKIATERIPEWAMCYIFNGDVTGLQDDEIEMVDKFVKTYQDEYCSIDFDSDVDDEPYFTHYPAFGLPCNAYDVDIYAMTD